MTSDTPRTDAFADNFDWESESDYDAYVGMRKLAHQLERELNALRWIPITERLPTIDDGNGFEDVEWSDGHEIWQGNYKNSRKHSPTHWRRITLP